jgi:hypothetical protein
MGQRFQQGIRVVNLQRDRWTGHAAQMEKFETRSKFWSADLDFKRRQYIIRMDVKEISCNVE